MSNEFTVIKLIITKLGNDEETIPHSKVWVERTISFNRNGYGGNFRSIVWNDCRPLILEAVMFVVESFQPLTDVLNYCDSDGDKIVLDDVDSFVEAIKYAERVGHLILITEEAECTKKLKNKVHLSDLAISAEEYDWVPKPLTPEDVEFLKNPPSPKKKHIKRERGKNATGGAVAKLDRGVVGQSNLSPEFINEMMEKLKAEVKGEIFESLDKRSSDYKKKFKEMMKQHRKENHANQTEELQCKTCKTMFHDNYYVCLEKKCLAHVCETCVTGHPSEHAMLRLPKNLRSGRRKLAEMASLVLMSKERGHKKHENVEKEKKKEKTLKFVDGVPENLSDMSCEILSTKDIIEYMEADDLFDVSILWDVKNTGVDWKNDVKLECLANSHPDMWPVAPSFNVQPLKSGELGTLAARVKILNQSPASSYSTHWILTVRGFRFCSLSAKLVKPIVQFPIEASQTFAAESLIVVDSCPPRVEQLKLEIEPVHENYLSLANEPSVVDDELELFLRSEELKNKSFSTTDDDLLSQYSCVSSNLSAHDDFDFEVVTKNAQMSNDGTPGTYDADSYVIATPLNTCDETDDGDIEIIHPSTNLTDFFNQLTSSLSTLASETNANRVQLEDIGVHFSFDDDTAAFGGTNVEDLPVVDPRMNDDYGLPVLESESPLLLTATAEKETPENEMFFMANEETPLLPTVERVRTFVVDPEAEEEERRELEELARSVENFQIQPPPVVQKAVEVTVKNEATSNSVNKNGMSDQTPTTTTNMRNDPVATVLTTALRVSSQALSTVSNVLQAVANHAPKQNANASSPPADQAHRQWQPFRSQWQPPPSTSSLATDTTQDWQPPKAWVPKSTQTPLFENSWTPPPRWTPERTPSRTQNEMPEPKSNDVDQKLGQLKDMGFDDNEKNMRFLMDNNFNLPLAILHLLGENPLME